MGRVLFVSVLTMRITWEWSLPPVPRILNRCVFSVSQVADGVFLKKKVSPNYRYKKCTSRGFVRYKKFLPGTKVLFVGFLTHVVMGPPKLERFSFCFPFPMPEKRNLSRRRSFFELKRDGGGWEEGRYVCRGAGVAAARRVCPCRPCSTLQNGMIWQPSDAI